MSALTPEISLETFAATRQNAVTLDVRETFEHKTGHVPGAVLIPMSELAVRLGELDKSRPLHVICTSGNRSRAMTKVLIASGFDAVSISGGTKAWISSGRAVELGQ